MSRILITLKPVTPYFFGGENTFGEGKITYFARSNYLPQQTTLLGLLRYELLLQNGLIGTDPDKNKWSDLIGPKGFNNIDGGYPTRYGAIGSISPLFLSNGTQHYITQALDRAYYKSGTTVINNCEVSKKGIGSLMVDFTKNTPDEFVIYHNDCLPEPILTVNGTPYDPKYGLASMWVRHDGQNNRLWDFEKKGFFIKHEQIGIHRELNKERSRKDEGNFFKKISFTLHDDYRFAFFADIDLPQGKILESRIVTMGGERSVFEMKITTDTNPNDSFTTIFNEQTFKEGHNRKHPVIILTSDAYCSDTILDHCLFSINDQVNFRNIITHQRSNINYSKLSNESMMKCDKNLTLIKRGSVLFPEANKITKVKDAIKNKGFETIGYNQFILIN